MTSPESASLALSTLRREVCALIAENRRMREALEAIRASRDCGVHVLRLVAIAALETKE